MATYFFIGLLIKTFEVIATSVVNFLATYLVSEIFKTNNISHPPSIFFYLAFPQGQGHHNSVSQLLWARSTYPTLSTFPVGGNRSTRRKPTTFGRALTLLFSHENWV